MTPPFTPREERVSVLRLFKASSSEHDFDFGVEASNKSFGL